MKAIVFDRFGEPRDVLQVRDIPKPEPGKGQVRVRMLATPINPSDLLTVRGQYGRLPSLPATPGFEGAGVIDSAGPGLLAKLRGLKPGRRVAVLNGQGGNWQEYVVLSARQVVPIPNDILDDQAATFFVNPATALVMTRRVLQIGSGQWLLQTAAGSALGRMIFRLGQHFGFRTIHVVRRREQADELKHAGAEAVICTAEENVEDRVRDITKGEMVPFALDAVGGPTGYAALKSLAPNGRMLVYGTLSNDPMPLDPRQLMTGQKSLEGFWLSDWVKRQGAWTMLRLFKEIVHLLRKGVLTTQVGGSFTLDKIREAVEEADKPGRPGKVLLRIGAA